MEEDLGVVGDGPYGQGATALPLSGTREIDKLVYIKESVQIGLFQTQILECGVKPLLVKSAHWLW